MNSAQPELTPQEKLEDEKLPNELEEEDEKRIKEHEDEPSYAEDKI